MIYLYCPEGVAGGIYDNNVHNMSMVSAAMRGNVSFVRTGRIGQWDDYKFGSGSYVRTGRRMTRKRQYRKNTDPDGCVGCPDKQTSSKWASKLVKPTGGRLSGRVHFGGVPECSLTQGGHFTAEAERSRRHFCRRQHCGVQPAL